MLHDVPWHRMQHFAWATPILLAFCVPVSVRARLFATMAAADNDFLFELCGMCTQSFGNPDEESCGKKWGSIKGGGSKHLQDHWPCRRMYRRVMKSNWSFPCKATQVFAQTVIMSSVAHVESPSPQRRSAGPLLSHFL